MKPYTPINCEVHDGLELACMRRAIHPVSWQENGQSHNEMLQFIDLAIENHEEFLLAENQQGQHFRIRLDMITSSLPY